MNRENYLKAVDTVCMNCIFGEDTCETCPVRQTVDSLYEFAPFEIWIAWEESECWSDMVAGTKQFKDENVCACFQFDNFDTFHDTMYAITKNPIASWYWVFIKGVPRIWGAMSTEDMDILDKYEELLGVENE